MSIQGVDFSKITLNANGQVELNDAMLNALSSVAPVFAGGSGETNGGRCFNSSNCSGSANGHCTNDYGQCGGSTNRHMCTIPDSQVDR